MSKADQPIARSVEHGLGAVRRLQLAIDVLDVYRHGLARDAQLLRESDIPRFAQLGLTASVQLIAALGGGWQGLPVEE